MYPLCRRSDVNSSIQYAVDLMSFELYIRFHNCKESITCNSWSGFTRSGTVSEYCPDAIWTVDLLGFFPDKPLTLAIFNSFFLILPFPPADAGIIITGQLLF